jgi:predicted RNase H-like HicB family nuclease
MHRFLIVIEKANGNYSAYSPDLPGCPATGETRDQVARNMYEAIEKHVRGLLDDKPPVPESTSFAEYIAIPAYPLQEISGGRRLDSARRTAVISVPARPPSAPERPISDESPSVPR